jgi:hypothetical protein
MARSAHKKTSLETLKSFSKIAALLTPIVELIREVLK